jgi:hypothetical protein
MRLTFPSLSLSGMDVMTHDGRVYDGEPMPRTERVVYRTREVVKHGASFGSALAMVISWSVHKSILWAIVQGIFSWFYVLYYAVTR